MKRKLLLLLELSSFLFFNFFISWTESKNETIIKVPYKTSSSWQWSWTGQWIKKNEGVVGKVVYYTACDVSSQQNIWIRSNVFLVGDARRIDVTVQYSVIDCSSGSLPNCKQYLKLFIHKAFIKYTTGQSGKKPIPDPYKKPEVYQLFGTTSPTNLTTGSLSGDNTNTETYSFVTNSTTPYHYLAIQYQGGCFGLYSVTISSSVCTSSALPSSLIQLPRTMAPVNGSIQVSGSCAANAQALANNITLYGNCNANGEWSSHVISGECWCNAGYGKYCNGSGSYCNECPTGSYQDKASGKACKPCPLNSVQDVDRRKCNCAPSYYRTKNQSISDNCTGQPSAPPNISYSFVNASFVVLNWNTPLDLGGRSDVYYEVECNKCNNEGKTCSMDCTGAVITHTPRSSRKATVQHLSAYTYYQFKVFSKNGVSHLAKKNGEKPKYSVGLIRTGESVPGAPVLKIEVLNSTSVVLRWNLPEPNGVIINYQVSYYPVGEETKKTVLTTTKISITITGLIKETKYSFQVRGSTRVGLGRAGNVTQMVAMPSSNGRNNGNVTGLSQEQFVGIIVGVVVLILLLVIIILAAYLYRRKQRSRSMSKSYLTNGELIPMDGHRLYIDPSTYGSPMEALMSNTEEIKKQDLKLDKNIGGGEFADVYKGTLQKQSESEIVAVKILKKNVSQKSREDFILEASIMGQFKHPNVIALKGVVTRSLDTPMMIVIEFMENGSLEHFLKLRDCQLTVLQLLGLGRGVASGMAYLSSMNFIHRDLAARNILVADNMASKISDFGLSRELDDSEDNPNSEYQTQGGKIPVRWTAPEAIRYKKFSTASDIWSYGIFLWETMSFSQRPYWEWDNFQVMDRVDSGYRLPAPMNCPKSIHNVMLDCWEKDKNKRPPFADIVKRLDELIRSPEKINDEQSSRFSVNEAHTNFGEVTSLEEWLGQINMNQYKENFVKAGYVDLDKIKSLEEDDLKGMGVRLIGHRNKMNKSIRALKNHSYSNA